MTSVDTRSAAWIAFRRRPPDPRLRLFCFPYGGGSASLFREWGPHVPADVDLCPVQLPGRERRFAEPAYTDIAPLIEDLASALRPFCDIPFAFFGHSMGALISFELARELRRTGERLPVWLLLSGRRAPHVPAREPPIHDLPDAAFLQEIREMNGTPVEVFGEPELLELYLPLLRADIGLCERYVLSEEPPLDIPFDVYGGAQDPDVLPEDLEGWRQHSSRETRVHILPGGHFYLSEHRRLFLESLAAGVSRAMVLAQRCGRI